MGLTADEKMIANWSERYGQARVDMALRIYDILVEECRAYKTKASQSNSQLLQFIQWFANGAPAVEFRFQGSLGFGGKFWDTIPWHVTYYSEDRSKERDAMEKAANERLKILQQEFNPNTIE